MSHAYSLADFFKDRHRAREVPESILTELDGLLEWRNPPTSPDVCVVATARPLPLRCLRRGDVAQVGLRVPNDTRQKRTLVNL